MYTATVGTHLQQLRNAYPLGLNQKDERVEEDAPPTPQMNIIKSIIDTLISKIASTKVRPYFSPVNGDYTSLKVLKQLQIYFDDLYDRQDITRKMPEAFRDACIFDTGVIYVNPFTYSIECLAPWQVTVLDAEYHYGKLTKALISFDDYPVTLLPLYGVKLDYAGTKYVKLEFLFDTEEKRITMYAGNKEIKAVSFPGVIPIVFLHYTVPIKGAKTTSIVDDLYNIQISIDLLNARINDAGTVNPANLIMVPEGSGLDTETLNNRAGIIYRYRPVPQGSNPVQVVTPAFINEQYAKTLEYLIQKAYEMVGISLLSSQSVNPLGANASGAALQSMENIESTRFETQLNQVVRGYIELARILIDIIPDDQDILPKEANRSGYTWKDVRKQASLINIQYSAQTLLSKDPSKKYAQILQLSQVGMIKPSKLARFLDMPDLSEVYNLATAAQDAVDKVIQLALEEDYFDIPKFVSYELLEESITTMQNQLLGAYTSKNKEVVESLKKLQRLDDILQGIMMREGFIPVQEAAPPMVSEGGIAAPGMVEAPTAMDAMAGAMGKPPETINDKNQEGDV
jgi:hypothetical protein